MKTVVALVVFFLASVGVCADWKASLPPQDKVAEHLQTVSVNVKAATGEGSGVIKTRKIGDKNVSFIWTAAHVVDSLRRVEEVIDNGNKKQLVRFSDAAIVREETQDGRRVGESKMDVKVIRFSKDEDLALLQVCKQNYTTASVTFYLGDDIPPIGTRLLHVGSLLGQMGANSMTTGIQSQIGRTLESKTFDQTTVQAFPGSSGGGVYLENGAMIAMVVRGAGESFNLVVPVRRLRKWAKSAHIEWAVDDNVPVPSLEQIEKLPIEDPGAVFQSSPQTPTPVKPVIRLLPSAPRDIPVIRLVG